MTALPRLADSARAARAIPDVGWLFAVGAAMLVARLPMGLVALVGSALVVLMVRGLRPVRLATGLLWPLMIVAWASALIATVFLEPQNILALSGSFIIATAMLVVAAVVLLTGCVTLTVTQLVVGVWCGLRLLWLIAVGEVVTGVKLISFLYPGTTTTRIITSHRLYASATFPNYNDLCVSLVLLCAFELARMTTPAWFPAFGRRWRWAWGRGASTIIFGTAAFLIVAMGSRGALMGLVVVALVLGVVAVRKRWPGLVAREVAGTALALATAGLVFLVGSGALDDNSNQERVRIIDAILGMWQVRPAHALVGFGSLTTYVDQMTSSFGTLLFDPHNLIFEIGIWYGIGTLIVAAGCWVVVVWRGLVRDQPPRTPMATTALVLLATYPVLGVVPSSTLRYYVFWLVLIAASAYVGLGSSGSAGTADHARDDHRDPAADHADHPGDRNRLLE